MARGAGDATLVILQQSLFTQLIETTYYVNVELDYSDRRSGDYQMPDIACLRVAGTGAHARAQPCGMHIIIDICACVGYVHRDTRTARRKGAAQVGGGQRVVFR